MSLALNSPRGLLVSAKSIACFFCIVHEDDPLHCVQIMYPLKCYETDPDRLPGVESVLSTCVGRVFTFCTVPPMQFPNMRSKRSSLLANLLDDVTHSLIVV